LSSGVIILSGAGEFSTRRLVNTSSKVKDLNPLFMMKNNGTQYCRELAKSIFLSEQLHFFFFNSKNISIGNNQ